MQRRPLTKMARALVAAGLLSALAAAAPQGAPAFTLQELQAALPARTGAWTAEGGDRLFDDRTIFDYIDGAGEVYRAYNMQMCLSRRYVTPDGPDMVLDIFDMGSPEEAFGVFTHDQDGEDVALGQGALYRPGWLSFWQDRFFVSLYMEEEIPATRPTILRLAEIVAAAIPGRGALPRILSELPASGLDPRTVRYLHHPIILNYHFYLADQNILDLGPDRDAVLARYHRKTGRARLLLVLYPEEGQASRALAGVLAHYLPEPDADGTARLEKGAWAAARQIGTRLAVILEADTRDLARDLLEEALPAGSAPASSPQAGGDGS